MHLQFCKKLLGIKRSSQNDFFVWRAGKGTIAKQGTFSVVNFWFKILEAEEYRYIKLAYQLMMITLKISQIV